VENTPNSRREHPNTKYRLVGVVVHSGQASGGHYYSYIRYDYRNIRPRMRACSCYCYSTVITKISF
jgi:ubiquitin C-terminal hydrolase